LEELSLSKVGFGVIGLKGVGRTHINAIMNVNEAELVAVADIKEEIGREVSSRFNVEWHRDYEEMLKREDIDAVTICTPHYLHHPMAMKALEYGKNVLVEKPMAIRVSEADEMVMSARRRDLKLGVVFQYRFIPVYREVKRMIEGGELGDIYRVCMEICTFRSQPYYDRDPWRGKWATEGGGVLINQAIHHLDLLQWLVGKPSKLQAWVDTVLHNIEVEDMVNSMVLFENGAYGVIQASSIDLPSKMRLEISGDRGKLIIDGNDVRRMTLERTVREYITKGEIWTRPSFKWVEVEGDRRGPGHTAVIEDFAKAILEDREPMVPGEDGRVSLEIVNAMILSSFEGRAVKFPIDREAYDRLMDRLSSKSKGHR